MSKYEAGFLGAGNMGGALAAAAARQVTGERVAVSCSTPAHSAAAAERLGCRAAAPEEILRESRFVFLGVKPQMLDGVVQSLSAPVAASEGVFVSMLAGVQLERLERTLGADKKIIRILPNTPCAVGQGVVLYTAANIREEAALTAFLDAMAPAGQLVELSEKQIDAASAVSGCGPAYVYAFIHAMAMGGVRCGLKYDVALRLAAQTALGSAQMVLETGEHPESLKVKVCSPAGTTIEGVKALEEHAFGSAVMDAVSAAWRRTLELAEKK